MTGIKTSGYAAIDITKGRKQLAKSLKVNLRMGPSKVGYPVRIKGYLTSERSNDDGESIEFNIDVSDFWIGPIEDIKS